MTSLRTGYTPKGQPEPFLQQRNPLGYGNVVTSRNSLLGTAGNVLRQYRGSAPGGPEEEQDMQARREFIQRVFNKLDLKSTFNVTNPKAQEVIDELFDFYGNPNNPQALAYQNHDIQHETLAEAYRGESPYMSFVVITKITNDQALPCIVMAPLVIFEKAMHIKWDSAIFNDARFQRTPEESLSRLGTHRYESGQDQLNRHAMSVLINLQFYKTKIGQEIYGYQVQQIVNAGVQVMGHGCIFRLMNAPQYVPDEAKYISHNTMRDLDERVNAEIDMWGKLQKGWGNLGILLDQAREIFDQRGVEPGNLVRWPSGGLRYNRAAPYLFSGKVGDWNTNVPYGPMGAQPELAHPSLRQVESCGFKLGNHEPAADPQMRRQTIGGYNTATNHGILDVPFDQYKTCMLDLYLYSETPNRIVRIPYIDGIKAQGLYYISDSGEWTLSELGEAYFEMYQAETWGEYLKRVGQLHIALKKLHHDLNTNYISSYRFRSTMGLGAGRFDPDKGSGQFEEEGVDEIERTPACITFMRQFGITRDVIAQYEEELQSQFTAVKTKYGTYPQTTTTSAAATTTTTTTIPTLPTVPPWQPPQIPRTNPITGILTFGPSASGPSSAPSSGPAGPAGPTSTLSGMAPAAAAAVAQMQATAAREREIELENERLRLAAELARQRQAAAAAAAPPPPAAAVPPQAPPSAAAAAGSGTHIHQPPPQAPPSAAAAADANASAASSSAYFSPNVDDDGQVLSDLSIHIADEIHMPDDEVHTLTQKGVDWSKLSLINYRQAPDLPPATPENNLPNKRRYHAAQAYTYVCLFGVSKVKPAQGSKYEGGLYHDALLNRVQLPFNEIAAAFSLAAGSADLSQSEEARTYSLFLGTLELSLTVSGLLQYFGSIAATASVDMDVVYSLLPKWHPCPKDNTGTELQKDSLRRLLDDWKRVVPELDHNKAVLLAKQLRYGAATKMLTNMVFRAVYMMMQTPATNGANLTTSSQTYALANPGAPTLDALISDFLSNIVRNQATTPDIFGESLQAGRYVPTFLDPVDVYDYIQATPHSTWTTASREELEHRIRYSDAAERFVEDAAEKFRHATRHRTLYGLPDDEITVLEMRDLFGLYASQMHHLFNFLQLKKSASSSAHAATILPGIDSQEELEFDLIILAELHRQLLSNPSRPTQPLFGDAREAKERISRFMMRSLRFGNEIIPLNEAQLIGATRPLGSHDIVMLIMGSLVAVNKQRHSKEEWATWWPGIQAKVTEFLTGAGNAAGAHPNFAQNAIQASAGHDASQMLQKLAVKKKKGESITIEFLEWLLIKHPAFRVKNGHFLKYQLENDGHTGIGCLYLRPNQTYMTGSGLYMKTGMDTAFTAIGHKSWRVATDAGRDLAYGQYSMYFKTMIVDNKKIYIMPNILIKSYVGGAGHEFWNPLNVDEDVDSYNRGEELAKDIFSIPVPIDWTPPHHYFSATGHMPSSMQVGKFADPTPHYPFADHISRWWNWPQADYDALAQPYGSEKTALPRNNFLVFQNWQAGCKWDPATSTHNFSNVIPEQGHFQCAYQGRRDVTDGRQLMYDISEATKIRLIP